MVDEHERFDTLRGLANDDENFPGIEEVAEIILGGGPGTSLAKAYLRLSKNPDKRGVWERFVKQSTRIYGADWERVIRARVQEHGHVLCSRLGCTELAAGAICDRCLLSEG